MSDIEQAKKHCTDGDFGYLSDEIRDYSSHASGLSEGTHYIHENRLTIWEHGVIGLEQSISDLTKQLAEKDRIIAQLRASIEELTGGGE